MTTAGVSQLTTVANFYVPSGLVSWPQLMIVYMYFVTDKLSTVAGSQLITDADILHVHQSADYRS
jgi:hypothetical protein